MIAKLLEGRRFGADVERVLFTLVANRALSPSSKLSIEDWVKDELEQQVFYNVADLLNLEVDLLYFDTTSTYFEVVADELVEGDTLRALGYSKDKRSDLAQIVIGLAVTREGIPIRVWTWPGNTSDASIIPEVKRDLVGWKLGLVTDRGFVSEDNLRHLQRTGGHYIVGEKLRSSKSEVVEALARPGRYQEVRDNLHIKEIIVGDGEARRRSGNASSKSWRRD